MDGVSYWLMQYDRGGLEAVFHSVINLPDKYVPRSNTLMRHLILHRKEEVFLLNIQYQVPPSG